MTRPSWRRATTSARVPASLVSPQNSPGFGASVSMGMSRTATSLKPMFLSKVLTACSCSSLDVERRCVSTSRAAASTAEAITARSISSFSGCRCGGTIHGKRCGSRMANTVSRTRLARSPSSSKTDDANEVSARAFKSSSEIGGAVRYRKAFCWSRPVTRLAISAGSIGSAAISGS